MTIKKMIYWESLSEVGIKVITTDRILAFIDDIYGIQWNLGSDLLLVKEPKIQRLLNSFWWFVYKLFSLNSFQWISIFVSSYIYLVDIGYTYTYGFNKPCL